MRSVKMSKSGTFHPSHGDEGTQTGDWSPLARRVVTIALVLHFAAILAGALAASPASELERTAAELFAGYHQLIDQGYGYRYYAPEPGPTPVVTATIRFTDGRPEETIRLPQRGLLPRLRYQRQLALANHLVTDFEEARRGTGDGARSAFARSYARHLSRAQPGCAAVTLYAQAHLIPDPRQVGDTLRGGENVDIDAEAFYTVPERIGEFPCDAF
jgi:hypothetical protein